MTRVLVTGGAGFIGSHIADALIARGDAVRILDVLHPAAHAARPDYLHPAAEFVRGDVRDGATVAAALEGVEHVCHQAAMVGLGTDIGDIADYVAHNDLGTAVLLRELAGAGFAGRLVLASSMVVYGEGRYACAEHGLVRPGPRRRGRPRRRPLRAAVPGCAAPRSCRAASRRTRRRIRATSTPRRSFTRSIWPRPSAARRACP